MYKYRVFISYSHEDKELAKKITNILENNGLAPIWDEFFVWGHGFPEQIKNSIAHAHVFVPIITEASSKRGWVHQEIGYAMALKIPILPVTLDQIPGEMLQQLIAISWNDNAEMMKEKLSLETFQNLVRHAQQNSRPLYECGQTHIERTMMMVEYSKTVLELRFHGHVRQRGALSSFHIPSKHINHPDWQKRYGSFQPDDYKCKLLREERLILEEHARQDGCSLIIDPYLSFEKYGPRARVVRLRTLLEFLESMPDDKVTIAINKEIPTDQHLMILGDWFVAESVSAAIGKGYKQTIFTRHAPFVQSRIEYFDQELQDLLKNQKQERGSSREIVISEIKDILTNLEIGSNT